MLFRCSGGLTTHNLWLQDQRPSCEAVCNSHNRRPGRFSHQNCLNMSRESCNLAATPPRKRKKPHTSIPPKYPRSYIKGNFNPNTQSKEGAKQYSTTSPLADKHSHVLNPETPVNQFCYALLGSPRSNASNRSTTCHFSDNTSLPPYYALDCSNTNSSTPRISRRPMDSHNLCNGVHRFVPESTRSKTK